MRALRLPVHSGLVHMSLQRRAAPQSSEQSLCSLTEAYAVFGVQEGASLQALKRSYHALALRHHPD